MERLPSQRRALRCAIVAAAAAIASAVGYAVQAELDYVSEPSIVGELGFYGAFAVVSVVAFAAAAVAAKPVVHRGSSWWGRAAASATALSAVGYVIQTILDYVDEPPLVGELEFYGLFEACALGALVLGAGAVINGRRRVDGTMRLGFIAVGYVLLVQVIQSLWD